ncbi:MAG: TonB-dependent receptor [Chitinophagales bacterium]
MATITKRTIYKIAFFSFLLFFVTSKLFPQNSGSVKGTVTNTQGESLPGTNVVIKGDFPRGTITNENGDYEISNLVSGSYEVEINFSFIGYKPTTKRFVIREGQVTILNITLEEQALQMSQVVVTGAFDERTKLESSIGITTINPTGIEDRNARSAGDLMQAVPGVYVDNAGGEVGAKIYARGLASGSRSQPGYRYISLQEDGLPIMSSQLFYGFIDMFHRLDATVSRVEAIRGGSASITSANSPGGIVNFISNEGGSEFEGLVKLESAVQGSGNILLRGDFDMGGPIGKEGWTYNIGGFYRSDEGARNIPYDANVGGQLKFNFKKTHDKGTIKFYGKLLNDRVTFYQSVPIVDVKNNTPLEGFDITEDTYFVNVQSNNIIDGRFVKNNPNAKRDFHIDDGMHAQTYSAGLEIRQDLGKGWILKNNIKYAIFKEDDKRFELQAFLPKANGPALFYGQPQFDKFTYTDIETGEVLYSALDGIDNLPTNFVTGVGVFDFEGDFTDIIEQISLSKKVGNHELTFGSYLSHFDQEDFFTAHISIGTNEAQPRLLMATHPNPMSAILGPQPDFVFGDENGLLTHGGGSYVNYEGTASNVSFFFSDSWEVNDKLNIDFGLRYENITHKGRKEDYDRPLDDINPLTGDGLQLFINPATGTPILNPTTGAPLAFPVGQDGDYTTWYDLATRRSTGIWRDFDYNYSYVSTSLGANLEVDKNSAVYGRLTLSNKAPELAFYQNNFTNIDIGRGEVEIINQLELGYKLNVSKASLFVNGFYSQMEKVPFQQFAIGANSTTVRSPTTFNTIRTIGMEIEGVFNLAKNFDVRLIGTLQNPTLAEFSYYNLNGTTHPVFIGDTYPESPIYVDLDGMPIAPGTPSDDFIEDFSDNDVPDVPKVMFEITPSYQIKNVRLYASYRYTGKRWGNRRNTVELDSFGLLSVGVSARLGEKINLNVSATNIADTKALLLFIDPGSLSLSVEDVTPDLIKTQTAVELPMLFRSVMPRIISTGLTFNF